MSCVDVNSIGKTPCKLFPEVKKLTWHPTVNKFMRKYFVRTQPLSHRTIFVEY